MEENFEKKSHKKLWVIISIVVILLILAVGASFAYLSISRKPENIFGKLVKDSLKDAEKDIDARKAKVDLEFSLDMESNDSEIAMANEIIKLIKLKATTEMDIDKKIFNLNLKAMYGSQEIISADGLIQNDEMYFYLNDIYSKFIEIPEEYLEGTDLSTIFEIETGISGKEAIKEMEQLLLDEVNSRELTQESVELDGEKVLKSTLKLTPKESLEIIGKMIKIGERYESTEELKDLIAELDAQIKDMEETDNYVDISIYTKGLLNEFVKLDIVLVNVEDDEVIIYEEVKKSKNESVINFSINEESTDASEAVKLIELTINAEDEYNGTIKLKMDIDEEQSFTLKVKYAIDYDAEISKRDTSNSISIDNLTDADYEEMYTNIENNPFLYSIIEQFMYTEEDYYYEDDYYYENEYDYDYDYNYVY